MNRKFIAVIALTCATAIGLFFLVQWLPFAGNNAAALNSRLEDRRFKAIWVRNAGSPDSLRLLKMPAALEARDANEIADGFPITAHRITSGAGDVLMTRQIVFKPFGLFGNHPSVSHERLTIFLPNGLPERGGQVDFGRSGAANALAIFTRGSGLNPISCFGIADAGMIGVAGAMPDGPSDFTTNGMIVTTDSENLTPGENEVIIHVSVAFDLYRKTEKGMVPCALPWTEGTDIPVHRYGITDTFIFSRSELSTLSAWEGFTSGLVTKNEFGPHELVKDLPLVWGPHPD